MCEGSEAQPRWARMGGVVRYRIDDVRAWLPEEREVQGPSGRIDDSGESTAAPHSNGWRHEPKGMALILVAKLWLTQVI